MNDDDFFKLPRLFVDAPLFAGTKIALSGEQTHYLKTVLRRQDGDAVRVFNGRDGEFLCTLAALSKKGGAAQAERQIRAQPENSRPVHLFFAPIKKARLDWLVEKAVELGATDLHPVITQNTEVREVNAKRLAQQMLEAAEQCERLDRPVLHGAIRLKDVPQQVGADTVFLAALERGETMPMLEAPLGDQPVAVLIGPEGGFTAEEAAWMTTRQDWHCVSLGPRILRCETAVCVALSAIMLHT